MNTPTAPLSFKVKGQDREGSKDRRDSRSGDDRGPSKDRDERERDRYDDEGAGRGGGSGRFVDDPMDEDEDEEPVVEEDAMDAMQAMLGFGGFGTTKGKKIVGNNVGAVRKEKKTEYRQYMNRVGGFNRPLSPSR